MDAAVVQVSKPVWNSRHYDSAPVQPLEEWKIRGCVEIEVEQRLEDQSYFREGLAVQRSEVY